MRQTLTFLLLLLSPWLSIHCHGQYVWGTAPQQSTFPLPYHNGTFFHSDLRGERFVEITPSSQIYAAAQFVGTLIQSQRDYRLYGIGRSYGLYNDYNDNGFLYSISYNNANYEPYTYHPLHLFSGGAAGSKPVGGLLELADGRLFGMTMKGGSNHSGVVFSFTPNTSQYQVHASMPAGAYPTGRLCIGKDGLLYGLSTEGGSQGGGMLFSVDPSGGTVKEVYAFGSPAMGQRPMSTPLLAKDGWLYGTCNEGGQQGAGTMFRYKDGTMELVFDFNTALGIGPEGALEQDAEGNIYGTTTQGGASQLGTVYVLPAKGDARLLWEFSGPDGSQPRHGVTLGPHGRLYGLTPSGGSQGMGTGFSLDPKTETFSKMRDMQDPFGEKSQGGLCYVPCFPFYQQVKHTICQGETYVFPDGGILKDAQNDTLQVSRLKTAIGGCDSTIVTQLRVFKDPRHIEKPYICYGGSWVSPDGKVFEDVRTPVSYRRTLQSQYGCDSTTIYLLSPNTTPYQRTQYICPGGTLKVGPTKVIGPVYADTTLLAELDTYNECKELVMLTLKVSTLSIKVEQWGAELVARTRSQELQWVDMEQQAAPIKGATSAVFLPTRPGKYAVIGWDGGCPYTSETFIYKGPASSSLAPQQPTGISTP